MKNKKLMLLIVLLTIGFAAVSTTLLINGTTNVAENTSEFEVYFSNAVENGTEKKELIKDKTHIAFTANLSMLGEVYELKYEVTNASKNYDASVNLNVPSGNEYISVTNNFDTSNLLARTKREGTLILKVVKGVTEEITFPIEITIEVNAVERTSIASDQNEDVHFTKLVINEEEQVVNGKEFKINLTSDENMITYHVTNSSREYDVDVTVSCEGENLTIENHFQNGRLNGNTTREGILKVTGSGELSCSISYSLPISRDTLASEEINFEENTDEIEPFPAPTAVEILSSKMNAYTNASGVELTYTEGNIHEMYEFKHDKTDQMPANTDYRYIGNDPYNYVKFNCTDYNTQSGCEIWRIIGLMPDEEGAYRLKLIRNDFSEKMYWNKSNKYSNNWETSEIRNKMTKLVNSQTIDNYVDLVKYFLGGGTNGDRTAESYYIIERGKESLNAINFNDKVGLMYPSDYIFTFGKNVNSACYNNGYVCHSKLPDFSWLYAVNTSQWLISPDKSVSHYVSYIVLGSIYFNPQNDDVHARPVVYLKPEITFKKGDFDGSKEKPYELKEIKN